MPAQTTAEIPTSPTPTPIPTPAPVDIPPPFPVPEDPEPAASDVGAVLAESVVVCVGSVLLVVSDVVAEVTVDVAEVLVIEVVEEDVDEEIVGGSSAVILKYADDTLGPSMLPWSAADPLKIQKKKTLDQASSKSYRFTVHVKELRSASVAALPVRVNVISGS